MGSRYLSLTLGIFVKILCGLAYAFSITSPTLRKVFGFDDKQVETVGLAGNIGQYLGLAAGFFLDRYGPSPTIFIGSLISASGFALLWAATASKLGTMELWHVCLFYAIGANGQPWFDTSTLVTNMWNFPEITNLIIGLDKTFNGLGSSIIASVYDGVFSVDDKYNTTITPSGVQLDSKDDAVINFLLFLPFMLLIVGLLGSCMVRKVSDEERQAPANVRIVYYGYMLSVLIALYALSSSLSQELASPPLKHSAHLGMFLGMCTLLLCYFVIPVVGPRGEGVNLDVPLLNPLNEKPLLNTISLTLTQSLGLLDFWLFFFLLFVGTGCGLVAVNNVADMFFSLGGAKGNQVVFVALISIASAAGRLITGFVTFKFPKLPVFNLLVLYLCLTVLGQLFFALNSVAFLTIASLLSGFSFGAYWACMPLIVKEMCGTGNLGAIYNFLNFAPMLGSFLLSVQLTASLYDQNLELYGQDQDGVRICVDAEGRCFRESSLILAGLALVGLFVGVWFRRRRLSR
jgi:MFS family permease